MVLFSEAVAAPGTATVILLGVGIVFFGLICIIALISLLSFLVRKIEAKNKKTEKTEAPASDKTENRGELVAAVSAAIAEELGCDISRIRIHSIKRL